MNIDLFTFIAQIINFIILVILLYFFLYKKIINAIDNREKGIRDEFERAREEKKLAEEEKNHYEAELRELDKQKENLIAKAEEEARQEKEEFLEEAKEEIEHKKKTWERKLETEKNEFLTYLQKTIGSEIYNTAQSVLQELANVDLQKQIFERFVNLLENLSEEQVAAFQNAYRERTKEGVILLSAFELSQEERDAILKPLAKILEEEPKIFFRIDPEKTLGITIKINSFRFSWTTKNYFEKLEDQFEKVLEEKHE